MRKCFLIAAVLLVFATFGVAQDSGHHYCDLTGTWYGGSDPQYQYLWTFTPIGDGRYSGVTHYGFDNRQFGYTTWTNWVGETVKTGPRTYESYGMSYWIWDQQAASDFSAASGLVIDPTLPEMDIVHSRLKLLDCNTLESTLDVWGGYFAYDPAARTPFVTTPDIDWLHFTYPDVTVLVETYHRMPNTCANCQSTPMPVDRHHQWPKKH